MINLQMLKKRAQQCLLQFLWRGHHSGRCKSLGSSPLKMSQAFHNPSIQCFNFLYVHPKVNTFKPLKCAFTETQTFEPDILQLFLRDLFIILNRFLAGSCSVKISKAFHDPSINLHRTWERYTRLKLLECIFISTQTFQADDSQLFLLDLFLPKLTVK